jgi:hypothetical protein
MFGKVKGKDVPDVKWSTTHCGCMGEQGYILHHTLLILALDGGCVVIFTLPLMNEPNTHWTGG